MKKKSRMTLGIVTWMTGRVLGPPVEMENTEKGAGLGDDNEFSFRKVEIGCLRDI